MIQKDGLFIFDSLEITVHRHCFMGTQMVVIECHQKCPWLLFSVLYKEIIKVFRSMKIMNFIVVKYHWG